jgi:hypothetical protein
MALPTIEQVLANPATHNWLKSALTSALDKDPVDAFYDAELLAKLLRARLDSILGLHETQHQFSDAAVKAERASRAVRRFDGPVLATNVYARREDRSA